MKRTITVVLTLAMVLSLFGTVTFAAQADFLTPVTDMAEAAESEMPMYLYALDGEGVPHYMRQVNDASTSEHGYAEKVGTTGQYSVYTTTRLSEAEPYSVVPVDCKSATGYEFLLQYYDAVGNKDYMLYLMTSGVGPNALSSETHAKHHFLWDEENALFYQMESSVKYVLAMKEMTATYAATSALPGMSQTEWRITCVKASEIGTAGIYPVNLAYHSHSYTVPVLVDGENHRLDCACGAEGTQLVAHSYGEDGSCVCGKRQETSLEEGIYYLQGAVNGTTYYFRQTGSGEKVTYTSPYSLYTTAEKADATLVDVILESSGGYSLAYPYNNTNARIYVYDVGSDGTIDTGVNTQNAVANHHFSWDGENAYFYQLEGDVKYVLALKELYNTNTKADQLRVQAVPESELSSQTVPVRLEAHTQHTCPEWTVEVPATTGTTGLKSGICTVCQREVQEVIPALTPGFCGKSISLQDAFAINFYVDQAAFADGVYADPYVIFEQDGVQTTVSEYAQRDGYYIFTCQSISPDKMGQTVTATLYAAKQDGTAFSVTTEYSVAQYCYEALAQENASDALRTLLVDTLNFGAVCQEYCDSDTPQEQLVNAQLTQEQLAWGSAEAVRMPESCRAFGDNDGDAKWYGVSALMGQRVQLRVYFTAEDATDLSVQAVSGENTWTLTDIRSKDGKYYVDFGYLNPAQMDDKVSFTVCRAGEAISTQLDYSIASYVAVWLNKEDADPAQVELVKAILRYGDGAKAYVNQVYDLQEDVQYLGRVYDYGDAKWFNWSASGFSVRFQGSGLKAKIASNAPDEKNLAYLKVYVDGVEQADILLEETMQDVVLAQGLDPNVTHTVEIRKRNSARSSTAGLVNLELLDGQKQAPAEAKEKLIEFIGDSLTVGYSAADTQKAESAWSTKTEDGTKTYAKQVADAFNAEYMVTAISGRGVVMNNGGGSGYLLPDIYPELDIYNLPGTDYDFALQPDVIVINLGTNDATNSSLDLDAFQTGVCDFTAQVRQNNPNAQIIWAYGMRSDKMTDEVDAAIQEAVAQLNTQGDGNVHYLELPLAEDMHLNHPTAAAYVPSGEKIIEKIEEITGW